MSKYEQLRYYLEKQKTSEVTLKLDAAHELIGFRFPASAYMYQAYWANQTDTSNRPWARAWQQAGYRVDGYSLKKNGGWVRFTKVKNLY